MFSAILAAVLPLVDKWIPDPEAKAKAQMELLKMEQEGVFRELEADLKRSLAQAEINKVEAADPNVFKSGWRPGAGWICVAALGYNFLVQPLLAWGSAFWQVPVPPQLDLEELFVLLGGMLGLGGMRSFEKKHKVA